MKTLIILHGWQSSKEKWQKVSENIEGDEVKVIVPDLPGFKPETELKKPWNLGDYVEWLKDFIQEREKACPEGIRPSSAEGLAEGFFLLGHSFGGRVAIKFAAKYPEKLHGLILVSSAGIKKESRIILCLTFSAYAKFVKSVLRLPGFKRFEPFFRKIFYYYILRKPDYYRARGSLKATFKNIVEEDLSPLLKEIRVPVLILWGKKDKITPLSDARLIQKEIKNSQLEILDNIGHTPHLENPKLLAEKVKKFLK